jgi:hypothetical protein
MNRIIPSLLCYTLASLLHADSGQYIVDINTDKLYLYDAAGEELATVKSRTVEKAFQAQTINGKHITGIPVLAIDDGEGLLSVKLPSYPNPVWLETMAVEIWPGNQLDCPSMAQSQASVAESGMTIGFGDHCKK